MNLLKNELDIYSSLFTKGYEMINKAEKENPNKLYSQNDSKIGAFRRESQFFKICLIDWCHFIFCW